jgi:excisionase family DNA binding protein
LDGWAKISEAAKYAGVKSRTFRSWLKSGLRYSRLPSGTVLVRYSDLDAFLERFAVVEDQVDRIVKEVCREF